MRGYLISGADVVEVFAVGLAPLGGTLAKARLLATRPCRDWNLPSASRWPHPVWRCGRLRTSELDHGPAHRPSGVKKPVQHDRAPVVRSARYGRSRSERHAANRRLRCCPAPTLHRSSAAGQGPMSGPAQHRLNNPSVRPRPLHATSGGNAWGPAVETTATKTGRDHLKRQARQIARTTGRRFPDVLAELRRAPRPSMRRPSTKLVLLCNGLAHLIDGGRCARPVGHHLLDGDGAAPCRGMSHHCRSLSD